MVGIAVEHEKRVGKVVLQNSLVAFVVAQLRRDILYIGVEPLALQILVNGVHIATHGVNVHVHPAGLRQALHEKGIRPDSLDNCERL